VKSLLTSNLLPSRLQYRISKPDGSNGDADCPGLSAMKNHNSWGFTLIEFMIVVAILGILAGIGLPAYRNHLEKAQIVTAVAEMKMITTQIEAYRATNFGLPADLSDVGYEGFEDPWGNPYIYVNLEAGGGASLGPSFASVKKGMKVSVLEKRHPMSWSATRANGLYAAKGAFQKRVVKSFRETLIKEPFKRTAKGSIVTTGGDGGNKRLLKTYSPAYHKNIMLVGSPLMEGGLILAKVNGGGGGGPVQARVNGNNNPLNSDFDLYSMGRDGKTHKEINQTKSLDDIIRAKEGNFIGPVSKYEN